jgi:hypothetical protein
MEDIDLILKIHVFLQNFENKYKNFLFEKNTKVLFICVHMAEFEKKSCVSYKKNKNCIFIIL